VTVEAVLVMPLMVAVTLGILQLAMVQQARVMTEYAAFQAVRAGIVWNGSHERMRDAALLSLAPTLGRADGLEALALTHGRALALDAVLSRLKWGGSGPAPSGLVRVDVLNPVDAPGLDGLWKLGTPRGAQGWEELDLDGADAFPQAAELGRHIDELFDLSTKSAEETAYRRATVLSIRLRYWYELRVPFANWFLFTAWFAVRAGRGIVHPHGLATADAADMAVLWQLAHGGLPTVGAGGGTWGGRRFFLPLTATYSMRMQSNFHRKWLMHAEGGGPPGAGARAP
jgi:hypothetical protein